MSLDATPWISGDNESPYRPGAPTCPRGHVVENAGRCEACHGLGAVLILPIRKVTEADIELPKYQTKGAAGFDLRADLSRMVAGDVARTVDGRGVVIEPGSSLLIPCGFAFEIPHGHEGQVRGRSSMTKRGILCPTGTIDSDYRGEVMACVWNLSGNAVTIEHGERIAQMIIAPAPQFDLVVTGSLSDTERGAGGFGSTGVK